jgi:hypothetical protein
MCTHVQWLGAVWTARPVSCLSGGCARITEKSWSGLPGAGSRHVGGWPDRVRSGVGIDRGGTDCRVATPSKLQRPTGDRVKTEAHEAAHLVASPARPRAQRGIWCALARTAAPI